LTRVSIVLKRFSGVSRLGFSWGVCSPLLAAFSISTYKESGTIKQDHVIKEEEFKERIRTRLMFEAYWSTEDGMTSFDPPGSDPPRLDQSSGGNGLGNSFPFESRFWTVKLAVQYDLRHGGCILLEEDYRSHWEIREWKLIMLKFWIVLLLQKR
jgi:hypothetical protein